MTSSSRFPQIITGAKQIQAQWLEADLDDT